MLYISHVTLTTGDLARTSRDDVAPEVTSLLAEWLAPIVNSGLRHPLPVPELAHFSAQAAVQDGSLLVTVYAGPTVPLVTFGVARRSRHGPALWALLTAAFETRAGLVMPASPWVAVALHPALSAGAVAPDWLGDFERCIAWAWLNARP